MGEHERNLRRPFSQKARASEILSRLMDSLKHRGGDGEATLLDSATGLALGHLFRANFSGRDRAPGPAFYQEGDTAATLDGSITTLSAFEVAGPSESGTRDAWALLKWYRGENGRFPEDLRGYFAGAVWDGKAKVLTVVEDPLSRKPLYFFRDSFSGLVVFSSELKGVLAHPEVPRDIDVDAISLYLSLGAIPAPYTPIADLRKLQPAECVRFEGPAAPQTSRYWRLGPQEEGPEEVGHWLPILRSELEGALARSTGSAPRVGVMLSGGVDSSLLLAALAKQGMADLKAFTVLYEGTDDYDLPWTEAAASDAGCEHTVIGIGEDEITPNIVAALFGQMDEPLETATRAITRHFLLAAARESGHHSLLVGSGGELAYGFMRYWRAYKREHPEDLPPESKLSNMLGKAPYMPFSEQESFLNDLPAVDPLVALTAAGVDAVRDFPMPDAFTAAQIQGGSWMGRIGAFKWMIPPLYGIEVRSPYLDEDFTSFGLRIPPALKGADTIALNKILAQQAYDDLLKMPYGEREKRPLPGPTLPVWLRDAVVAGLLKLGESGLVKKPYAESIARRYRKSHAKKDAWILFVLFCWLERYV